jgi:cardiolipin synthase
LIWSWWPWALFAIYLLDARQWWGALGAAAWAGVCSLSSPVEFPPQYGLDHGLEVGSDEFVHTMAGAAGVPFFAGNKLVLLNNGDCFYPAMLGAIERAERSITIEAYIYWAGTIGMTFAQALAAAAARGVRVKILLDAFGSASIGNEILRVIEKGGCHVAWYTRSA